MWNGVGGLEYKTVYAAGIYTVTASTSEGCSSYDTLKVPNVWLLPVVKLDDNNGLCAHSTRNLNAGSFSSYQWQDGSTSSTYSVKDVGTYYVQVLDNHNCIGSDTTVITTIFPLPTGFLPPDTALCSYSKITLKSSQNYSSYLWQNGSVTSNITIEKPGIYWLQVVDKNNCVGIDSIVITPKNCMSGVYIPTAFTPNKDYRNDIFRVLVFGRLQKFEFIVYNRWGQIVFQTTDASRGWDGKIGGVEQKTDVYLWTCRYQLEGSAESFEKGSVLLIR